MRIVSTIVSLALLLAAVGAAELNVTDSLRDITMVSLEANSSVTYTFTMAPCLSAFAYLAISDERYSLSVRFGNTVIVTSDEVRRERASRAGGSVLPCGPYLACNDTSNMQTGSWPSSVIVKPSLLRRFFVSDESCTLTLIVNNTGETAVNAAALSGVSAPMMDFGNHDGGFSNHSRLSVIYGIELVERNLDVMMKLRPTDGHLTGTKKVSLYVFDETTYPILPLYPSPLADDDGARSNGAATDSFLLRDDGISWHPGLYVLSVRGPFGPPRFQLSIEQRYKRGYAMNLSIVAGVGALTVLMLCVFAGGVALIRRRRAVLSQNRDGSDAGSHMSSSDGATKADIDALELKQFRAITGGTRDTRCAICLIEFTDHAKLRVLPCDHYFHTQCAEEWLTRKRLCPLCLRDIVPEAQIVVLPLDADASLPPPELSSSSLELLSAVSDVESASGVPNPHPAPQSVTPFMISMGGGRVGRWQGAAVDTEGGAEERKDSSRSDGSRDVEV